MPDAPITPTLRLWTDELNVWLDYPAANADVSVNEISADETVSATLKYSKTGMLVGDLLSARLIAGPSVLPGALSDLISITKVNPGTFPDAAGSFTKTVKSDRSRTYAEFFDGGSLGLLDSVAVYPGDQPLFTVDAENTGKVAGWFNLWDNWSDASFDFGQFVGAEPPLWDHYISPSGFCANSTRECLDMYVFLNPGEKASYQFTLTKTSFLSTGTPYTAFVNALYGYYYAPDWSSYTALTNAGAAGYLAPWFFGYGETPDLDMWLRSEKSGPDFVVPGESFSYVISLHNPTSFEKEFYVEDALPKEVEFEGCSSCEYISATHTVAWTVIVPPEGLELSFDVTADLDLKQGQKILNEATVSDKFEGTPFAWLDNTVDVDEGVDLVLSKTVDKLVGVWNDVLTYNIVLRNDGDHAQAAYVDDPLPAHLTLLPNTLVADKGTVTFDSNTNTIHWVGNLDHGEDVVITFKAAIDPGTPTGLVLLNPATAGAANWNSQVYSSAVTEQMIAQWYLPAVYNAAPPAP